MRALAVTLLVVPLWSSPAAAADCVDGPRPVQRAPRDLTDRPANGLPTLGTMMVAAGAGTLASGLFLGVLGTFAAVDQAPREQVLPLIFLAVTVSSFVVLMAVVLMAGGMVLYWWGWSLIAPPPDTRPRCPPAHS